MLIALLKGRRKEAKTRRPTTRTVALDVSGPLPSGPVKPSRATDDLPYREDALVAVALRPAEWRRDAADMSSLPREVDPFETDFPWIGWVEPRHESFVRSETRSPTFEQDLKRVLAIFAN